MTPDATFRYGGALVIALVLGIGFGLAVDPTLGVLVGLVGGAVWLALGLLTGRNASRR